MGPRLAGGGRADRRFVLDTGSAECLALHVDTHALFCARREVAADDGPVARATRGYEAAVAAAKTGDAEAAESLVTGALETLAALMPPAAFKSDKAAFIIPSAIRELFFNIQNLGAKASHLAGRSTNRFKTTLASMGAEWSDGPGFPAPAEGDFGNSKFILKVVASPPAALIAELDAHGVASADVADDDLAGLVVAARRRLVTKSCTWNTLYDAGRDLEFKTLTLNGKKYEAPVKFVVPKEYDKWLPYKPILYIDSETEKVVHVAIIGKFFDDEDKKLQVAAERPIIDEWEGTVATSAFDTPGATITVVGRGAFKIPKRFDPMRQILRLDPTTLDAVPRTGPDIAAVQKALVKTTYLGPTCQYAIDAERRYRAVATTANKKKRGKKK